MRHGSIVPRPVGKPGPAEALLKKVLELAERSPKDALALGVLVDITLAQLNAEDRKRGHPHLKAVVNYN